MVQKQGLYRVLVGNHKKREKLQDTGVDGIIKLICILGEQG
jgi:hypothetical protein